MLEGQAHPDFGLVAAALSRALPRSRPGGGAVCVYHRGECVVDIWGGTRDEVGNPWERDTLALSFSTTKGVVSTLAHLLVDRGLLAYDDPIARHWPGFEVQGKHGITLRHLLCHEAGLDDVRGLIDDASQMLDWGHMTRALERAAPARPPGVEHGYHALTFGWLVGELLQRATGRTLAELLETELAKPLGLDGLYVGVPEWELARCAVLVDRAPAAPRLRPEEPREPSVARRVARWLPRLGLPIDLERTERALAPRGIRHFDWSSPATLRACIPAANGTFTARSLARLYAALAAGGTLDGVDLMSPRTVAQAAQVQSRGLDRVIPLPMGWRLGYHRVFGRYPSPGAFGHFGLGGSGAFADPERQLALAFVTCTGGGTPFGDGRIVRILGATIRSVRER